MRGSVAKRLRRIAASLGLEAETKYAPGGPLRRRGDKGAPIPRPFVLRACERLAYKQAKALYKGKSLSILQPGPEQKAPEQPKEFREAIVDSARTYAQS